MLFRLWNKIRGYAIIKLDGVGQERLMNRIDALGIDMWDIKRNGRMSLTAKVPYTALGRLRRVAKECNCELTILSKAGFTSGLGILFGKKVFFICSIIAILAIVAFTKFVWIIEVQGSDTAVMDMFSRLEANDIRQGTLWADVDTISLQRKLMINNGHAASVLVNRQGIKLIVEIVPLDAPPEYVENRQPCDIVSSMDGVLVSVTALEGVPVVDAGQTVKKGDILIRGEFSNEEMGYSRKVAARGDCVARVWHTGTAQVPADEVLREFTGRECLVRTLHIGEMEFAVDSAPEDFADYIVDTEKEQPLSSLFLPVYLRSQYIKEVNVRIDTRQYSKAESDGKKLAYADALSRMEQSPQIYAVYYSSSILPGGQMEVRAFIETEEQIGVVQYH